MAKGSRGGKRSPSTSGLAKIPEGARARTVAHYRSIYEKAKKQYGSGVRRGTLGAEKADKDYLRNAKRNYDLAKKGYYSWKG